MLRQRRVAALLGICLSTLVLSGVGQVSAARNLQLLSGKSALQKYHARRLLQTQPSLGITGGSNPLNSNAVSGGLNTGSSSNSILGSGGANTGATKTTTGEFSGSTGSQSSSSGSLLDAVQNGSINPSPPPLNPGLTGMTSPPLANQQPQLNYNPLSGFNSGSGRHLRVYGA
ncbi:hypothetical protein COCOBI_08-0870 [Coccomyxa sp. Obi]|nr:hypothetical protein COCOBI_08-0870 [Coccomyxa sp. Obi]